MLGKREQKEQGMNLETQHNNSPIFDVKGRYAYALFELAQEEDTLAALEQEMSQLQTLITEDNHLIAMMESQTISQEEKLSAIEALAARAGFSATLHHFLALIIKNNRAHLLPDILATFRQISDQHKGITHIDIRCAQELKPPQQDKLQHLCQNHFGEKTQIKFSIDESLMAGVQINLPNYVLDATLAAKFSQLEDNFKHYFQTI